MFCPPAFSPRSTAILPRKQRPPGDMVRNRRGSVRLLVLAQAKSTLCFMNGFASRLHVDPSVSRKAEFITTASAGEGGASREAHLPEECAQLADNRVNCRVPRGCRIVWPEQVHQFSPTNGASALADQIRECQTSLTPGKRLLRNEDIARLEAHPASEINSKRLRQGDCGKVIQEPTDDLLVQVVQQHAREMHRMDMTREQILAMAEPA